MYRNTNTGNPIVAQDIYLSNFQWDTISGVGDNEFCAWISLGI